MLRDYQARAVADTLEHLDRGMRSVCVVAPTGAGKTVIGAELVQRLAGAGKRVLWIAHRIELVEQAIERMGIECGRIIAGKASGVGACVVASLQTLVRRDVPAVDCVIIDEAHHAASASYQKILDAIPAADLIGLTATPCRLDGKGLGEIFNTLVAAATTTQLIGEGHLVKPSVFTVPVLPDLKGVAKTAGDFAQGELEERCNVARLRGDIVEHWQGKCAGKPTVMFAVSLAHSRDLIADFDKVGVKAVHVDGTMPRAERDAALRAVRAGDAQILSNVGIVTEGWDFPALEVCILARPTASLALLLQMWGRIMRPMPGKQATVLDHAGNVLRHGVLPWTDVDWTLDATKRKATPTAVINCPSCYTLQASANAKCEACGAELHPKKEPKKRDKILADAQTQLVEIDDLTARTVLGWLETVKDKPDSVGQFTLQICERFRQGAKARRPLPPDFTTFVMRQKGNLGRAAWVYKKVKGVWP